MHKTPSELFVPDGASLFTRGRKEFRFTPSKPAPFEAAFFEAFSGSAWTEIVTAKFLFEQFVAVDDAHAPFDLRFRWITPPPLAHSFERRPVRRRHS